MESLLYFHVLHVFDFVDKANTLRQRVLMLLLIRISMLVAKHSSTCSSGRVCEFLIRRESNGICCQCPYGCVQDVFWCSRHAWWGSRDPLGCLVSNRQLSWYEGLCCRWQSELERLHENHEEWYLKNKVNFHVKMRSSWGFIEIFLPICDGVIPFFPNFLICSLTSSAFNLSHDGTDRRYGNADCEIPFLKRDGTFSC